MAINPFQPYQEAAFGGADLKARTRNVGQMGTTNIGQQGYRGQANYVQPTKGSLNPPAAKGGGLPQGQAGVNRPDYSPQQVTTPQRASRRNLFGSGSGNTSGANGVTIGKVDLSIGRGADFTGSAGIGGYVGGDISGDFSRNTQNMNVSGSTVGGNIDFGNQTMNRGTGGRGARRRAPRANTPQQGTPTPPALGPGPAAPPALGPAAPRGGRSSRNKRSGATTAGPNPGRMGGGDIAQQQENFRGFQGAIKESARRGTVMEPLNERGRVGQPNMQGFMQNLQGQGPNAAQPAPSAPTNPSQPNGVTVQPPARRASPEERRANRVKGPERIDLGNDTYMDWEGTVRQNRSNEDTSSPAESSNRKGAIKDKAKETLTTNLETVTQVDKKTKGGKKSASNKKSTKKSSKKSKDEE